jgi:hypothetical protein
MLFFFNFEIAFICAFNEFAFRLTQRIPGTKVITRSAILQIIFYEQLDLHDEEISEAIREAMGGYILPSSETTKVLYNAYKRYQNLPIKSYPIAINNIIILRLVMGRDTFYSHHRPAIEIAMKKDIIFECDMDTVAVYNEYCKYSQRGTYIVFESFIERYI